MRDRPRARSCAECCQATSCPLLRYGLTERPRQLHAGALVSSLAGDDLGPDARHRALGLGVEGRDREELLHRRLIGIDRGIAEDVLVDELLRSLVAVGLEYVVRRLGGHL